MCPPSDQLQANESTPWIVFADKVSILAEPRVGADSLGELALGSRVTGRLFVGPEKEIEWLEIGHEGRPAYILRCYLTRPHPSNLTAGNLPIGSEVVNRWWALPLDYEPTDLVEVAAEFRHEADRVYRLRKPAADALEAMLLAARKDGLDIRICSDYRSGKRQREIYLRAISQDGPEQRYSAPPGHSEHQLGTTVDLVDGKGEYLFSQDMDKTDEGRWLERHAPSFGFRRSYYEHNVAETGYISEPWHWRFVGKG